MAATGTGPGIGNGRPGPGRAVLARGLMPAVTVPESYSELAALQRHRKIPRAVGPCLTCAEEPPQYGPKVARFTYDHCHAHDYVRGALCRTCNSGRMKMVDERIEDVRAWDDWPAFLAHWNRCPQCAAEGWRPLYRRDHAGAVAYDHAIRAVWRAGPEETRAARRANPAKIDAELHEIGLRAALAVSPTGRFVYGGLWAVPVCPAEVPNATGRPPHELTPAGPIWPDSRDPSPPRPPGR